ncbi:hypothetical protein RR46_02293 [Papilio xuthus]|uniref:Uncharacterized protein n=1 Tax=Papilio xuthus TaxID=66420 RepID=A0A194QQG5_PAPXU|nr:hypothetical protein RR46_02293 [Papilio xuthus]
MQQTTATKTEKESTGTTTPASSTTTSDSEDVSSKPVSSKPQKGQGNELNKANALLKKRLNSLASKLGLTCQLVVGWAAVESESVPVVPSRCVGGTEGFMPPLWSKIPHNYRAKFVGVILALLLLDFISAMPGVREVRQASEAPPKEAGGEGESNPLISITNLLSPSQFAQLLLAALTKPGTLMKAR